MNSTIKVLAVIIIIMGLYLGVRFMGSVVHYACAVPGEDCPPPFYGLGEIAWYGTGGSIVPLWRKD